MQIEIIQVAKSVKPNKNGSYGILDVAFKGQDGKVNGKKIMSFASPGVFSLLENANQGELYDIVSEKDAKGYWQWVKATRSEGRAPPRTSAPPTSGNPSPRSTFETPEERAKRQVYIIRQSSLERALQYFELTKNNKASVEEVKLLAQDFCDFVMGTELKHENDESVSNLLDMSDDIPH